VSDAARLDRSKMTLVHGEDTLRLQTLRGRNHRRVGQAERQAPILNDQFPTACQVFGRRRNQLESPGLNAVEEVHRGIGARRAVKR
jgi:hypothetical protein